MSKPKIIVATDATGLIGLNGNLPWRKSADLKRFKRVTMGGALIMGRATWESIGRPLPGRQTIVLTKDASRSWEGVKVSSNIADAVLMAGDVPVWVAGGASIYEMALPLCDELDVTVVQDQVSPPEGSKMTTLTWFRDGLIPGFILASQEQNPDDPSLTHCLYVRK